MNNLRDTFGQLRNFVDGTGGFITGHQILKIRRINRKIPAWTKSDKKIQDLLLKAFPRLNEDSTSRKRASRWFRVIHLYFRQGWTYGQVADEIGIRPKTVQDILQSISRVSRGYQANGSGKPLGAKKGRPRKYVR